MKPIHVLLISTLAAITIVVMATFDIAPGGFVGIKPASHNLPDSVAANALFVCPVADPTFDEIARELSRFRKQLNMIFLFSFMFILAVASWAFYQNLIKDKFEKKSYNLTFFLAKALFWVTLAITILLHSPNSYRIVGIKGSNEKFVLCESDTPGSRPVRSSAVIPRSKIGS
ncbi:MAG: hypothetical protein FWG80_01540 [Alphaproteobacteria bacterium]|nr:hypothetical protein [Alphaproteobacteria bacterium]